MLNLKSKNFLLFSILVVSLLNCNRIEPNDGKIPNFIIKNHKVIDVCDASDWLDAQIIELETAGADSYIGDVANAFKIVDNKIILFDRTNTIKVTTFDLSGKFLWQITASNEGYEFFDDIGSIEFYDDRFEVYDQGSSVFYYYDYNSKYLGKKKLAMDFEDKINLAPNLFAFNTYQCYNYSIVSAGVDKSFSLILLDSTGVVDALLTYPRYINDRSVLETFENFSKYKDDIFYHRIFTDTVYKFEGLSIVPSYTVQFTKNHLGPNFFINSKENSLFEYAQKNENPFVMLSLESKKYVMNKYYHSRKGLVFSCISKKLHKKGADNELCNAGLVRIKDRVLPIPYAYNDGKYVTLVNRYYYRFLQEIEKYEDYPSDDEVSKISAKIGPPDDTENPVLIIYTLKE